MSRIARRVDQTQATYHCALMEYLLQSGGITPGGFQGRGRAKLGCNGHRQVKCNCPEGYESEVEVSHRVEDGDDPIELRGGIDELYPAHEPAILEEIVQ
jgi:hypothetical protein